MPGGRSWARGVQIGDQVAIVDEAQGVGVDFLLLGDGGVGIGEIVAVGKLDGRTGKTEERLVVMPGGAGHLLPLGREGGGYGLLQGDAGVWSPGAGSAEGTRFRRAVFGVDGDGADAGALQQDGRGEAEGSAADDGDVGLGGVGAGESEGDGALAGAPGERPAGAAVAVVMHDQFIPDALGLDARADGAERTQAYSDLEQAVFVGADGRERRDGVVEGKRGRGLGFCGHGWLAAGKQGAGGEGGGGLEKGSAG